MLRHGPKQMLSYRVYLTDADAVNRKPSPRPVARFSGAFQHKIPAELQQRDEPWRYGEYQGAGGRSISAMRHGSRLQVRKAINGAVRVNAQRVCDMDSAASYQYAIFRFSVEKSRPGAKSNTCAAIPVALSLQQDGIDTTRERQIPGREVLLFRSNEQQRELPVSSLSRLFFLSRCGSWIRSDEGH